MPFINCIVDLRLNILNDSPRCTKTFTKLMMKSVLTANAICLFACRYLDVIVIVTIFRFAISMNHVNNLMNSIYGESYSA